MSVVCDVSWGSSFLHREGCSESKQQRKTSSRICLITVVTFFADFKISVPERQLKEILRPETSDELQFIAQTSHLKSEAILLAFPTDVTNT